MKKKLPILILIPALLGIAFFGLLISKSDKPDTKVSTQILGESTKKDISYALSEKSLSEIDSLIEIQNKKDAVIMEVTDQKKIREFDPLFGRAYQKDLIVFLPDQTIVFDPTTKTIRDIISKSFYEEVKK